MSTQIDPLFALLDDPDPVVQRAVRERLLEMGPAVVPALRRFEGDCADPLAQEHARAGLRAIGVAAFRRRLSLLLEQAGEEGEIDLLEGAFLPGTLLYPELRVGEYAEKFEAMAALVEPMLRRCENGYAAVQALNHYLVDELGFQGCRQDRDSYYDPENSCLNRVVDRRVGNPIGLSVVWLLVGWRLGLPLSGVGFPTHFLLRHRSSNLEFFVDPFSGGRILTYSDCRRHLQRLDITYRPEYLAPMPSRGIVARMMRNLAEIERGREPELAGELEHAIRLLVAGDVPADEREDEEGS